MERKHFKTKRIQHILCKTIKIYKKNIKKKKKKNMRSKEENCDEAEDAMTMVINGFKLL